MSHLLSYACLGLASDGIALRGSGKSMAFACPLVEIIALWVEALIFVVLSNSFFARAAGVLTAVFEGLFYEFLFSGSGCD